MKIGRLGLTSRKRLGESPFTIRYALFGVAFGLLFPLVGTVVVILNQGMPLTFSSAAAAQTSEPLLWIIDLAPFILGMFAALIGRREDRLRQTARQLHVLVDTLEERVKERTRDLDRAVEIGHNVTQVDNLNQLLKDAVELISASFNLYHVQVYLVDSAGRNLVLRAATGESERQKASRQRQPIGLGSVAGAAAVEKQTVVVANAATSQLERPRTPSTGTWSEVAMPLLIGSRLIGVLNLQSDEPGHLTAESLPALEAVAGQLAIAVEHARLVSEATRARAEIEAQARRLARSGWEEFLNAIDRSEIIGYTYDLNAVAPLQTPLSQLVTMNSLTVPIEVSGEPIGAICIEGAEEKDWSRDEVALATVVAQQIAQQVENLRLISDADFFRAEAEAATRHLTREGWDAYLKTLEKPAAGYSYDLSRVDPLPQRPEESQAGQSTLTKTLTVRGETIGLLEVANPPSQDEETTQLVTAVADQLSSHLENLRLSEQREQALAETELQAHRLALLNELGQALAIASTPEDVYGIAADRTWRIVPSDRTSIAILNETDDSVVLLALKGRKGAQEVGDQLPIEGTAIGTAITENQVVVVNQTSDSGIPGIESFMVAPLKAGGRTFGTLNVGSDRPNAYDAQDERLLLQAASLLAATLESRRLFSETEQRAKELELINQMAQAVSQQLELDQLVDTIYQQIQRTMLADILELGIYDSERQVLDYPVIYESGRRGRRRSISLSQKSEAYQVILSGEVLLLNKSRSEIEAKTKTHSENGAGSQKAENPASIIHVPLGIGQSMKGILTLRSYQADAYKQSDVTLLQGIANYIWVGLENARLFQQARIRAQELSVLNEMGQALTSQMNVESVLMSVYEHTSRLMDASSFYVALYDSSRNEVTVRLFGEEADQNESSLRYQAGKGITEYVIRSGEPLLIRDSVSDRLAELGIKSFGRIPESWLGVPMVTGESVIGIVAVQNFKLARAYTEHHTDLLVAVASQAAIAVENARLFQQVQARARRERILREVTARVRGTVDVDMIMRTAATEVGRALGRKSFVLLDNVKKEQQVDAVEES